MKNTEDQRKDPKSTNRGEQLMSNNICGACGISLDAREYSHTFCREARPCDVCGELPYYCECDSEEIV